MELPIFENVGGAIINYLKNARPKTDSDHMFVRQVPSYTNFNQGAVGALVRVPLQKSGIHLEGKKKIPIYFATALQVGCLERFSFIFDQLNLGYDYTKFWHISIKT